MRLVVVSSRPSILCRSVSPASSIARPLLSFDSIARLPSDLSRSYAHGRSKRISDDEDEDDEDMDDDFDGYEDFDDEELGDESDDDEDDDDDDDDGKDDGKSDRN